MTPKPMNLIESNRTMLTMLSAVTTPREIRAKLRAARITPASDAAMVDGLVGRAREAFDTDAVCFQKIHAEAGDVQAIKLDGHGMLLAGSYTRYLLGAGDKDDVLRDMIALHQSLLRECGDVSPTDAEQAVHEILNGAAFIVNEAIAEARTRGAEITR